MLCMTGQNITYWGFVGNKGIYYIYGKYMGIDSLLDPVRQGDLGIKEVLLVQAPSFFTLVGLIFRLPLAGVVLLYGWFPKLGSLFSTIPLNIRCRNIIYNQKGFPILRTTQINILILSTVVRYVPRAAAS